MFDFAAAPVPVREDLKTAYTTMWAHFARPGAVYDGAERRAILDHARSCDDRTPDTANLVPDRIAALARTLYCDPAAVDQALVRDAADRHGEAAAVEVISLVSMLSAVDGAHRALDVELEPLPDPISGPPTGRISPGLERRRTHVPMPQGAIPSALDLVPSEAFAFQESFGPQYMTGQEMAYSDFERSPGLNRAQMELVSSRTSLLNQCFY
ncbi:MAG: hypothetical protein BMS9Abin17_0581 [Acidimicrobiia bacterium]|nr:MAG: hypothetical protein BMS9Abin17_0581 [Acidimicrobiia bacterium]